MKLPRPKGPAGSIIELVVIVATALLLALGIQAFIVKPYRIPSGSMLPTLHLGQRVLVDRIGERFGPPSVGDIVVFHPPTGADDGSVQQCGVNHPADEPCPQATPQHSDQNFIKRLVAGPGDTISVRDGHVVLNGKLQKESFIKPCPPGQPICTLKRTITIPKDHYFMMGDNRGSSDDSRYWGPVPKSWLIGPAFATYWPPGRVGLL